MNDASDQARILDSPVRRLDSFWVVLWLLLFWLMFFSARLPNNPPYARLDIVKLLPQIYEQWIFPDADPRTSSGWKYFPQRFDLLLIAGVMCAGGICIGRLLLRALGLFQSIDRVARLALAAGLGYSGLSLITLGLGEAGLLNPVLFWVMLLAVIAGECGLSLRSHRREQITAAPASKSHRSRLRRWSPVPVICGGICALFLLCMLLGAMLPSTDFDVKEYHLEGPKEYFLNGRVTFLPHNAYTSFPFLTEMLSLCGMVLRGDWYRGALVGKTVLMTFAPITGLAVFCVARRAAGPLAGWLTATIYLTIPWTYRIAIIAYTEGALCAYVALSWLAFTIWQDARSHQESEQRLRRLALLVGLLSGSAIATKYPGLVLVAIPLGLAMLLHELWGRRSHLRNACWQIVFYGAGVLAAFGPWMLKNVLETGNPVYPLAYSVFGGTDWNEELNEKWKQAHSPPVDLLADWQAAVSGVAIDNDWQSPLLFGLAPLILLPPWNRRVWAIAVYAGVILGVWFVLTHRIDRFWVPVNPLMAVLAGCGLAAFLRGRNGDKPLPRGRLLATIPVMGLVVFAVIFNLGFISTGLGGNNAWLMDLRTARQLFTTPSIGVLESLALPEDATVLFVGEAQVFDANFPYRYNTVFDENLLQRWTSHTTEDGISELLPPAEAVANLRQHGITHVMVNWKEVLRYRATYGFTDFISPERFQQLEESGVLVPMPLPNAYRLTRWELTGEQADWAQQLRVPGPDEDALIQYQLFRVNLDVGKVENGNLNSD